jgi:hypothetical protein
LWYIDGVTYLGTVYLRHRLTPLLTRRGGQIGYQVAPRHRRQGHATAMLAAALAYCRDTLGLIRVLVTCAESNTASRRVVEANGGELENTLDGECWYWIAIPAVTSASSALGHAVATILHRPTGRGAPSGPATADLNGGRSGAAGWWLTLRYLDCRATRRVPGACAPAAGRPR